MTIYEELDKLKLTEIEKAWQDIVIIVVKLKIPFQKIYLKAMKIQSLE